MIYWYLASIFLSKKVQQLTLRSSERRYKAYAILLSDKVSQIQTKTKSVFTKTLNQHKQG